MSEERKTIGNLNGKWSILFRATLAVGAFLQPALVAWSVWVTAEVFDSKAHREPGNRFMAADAKDLESRLHTAIHQLENEMRKEIALQPAPEFRKKVDSIEAKLEMIASNVVELRVIVANLK